VSLLKTHELKCWPSYFEDIIGGRKTFEIRKNDRKFHIGDVLRLKEYDLFKESYTGRQCDVRVIYMFDDDRFLQKGYVCMGIEF
jgi:uncharacterized protein YqfB (UPF0267 family)